MPVKVIGTGVGRTGTYSLKLALKELGLGPCHHMEDVLQNMPVQVPLWAEAVKGRADWEAIYKGYNSAVDWPTAAFFRELRTAYPSAKFVLTVRSPESWAESFSETIYKLLAVRDQAPKEKQAWLQMGAAVIDKTGFPNGLDVAGLTKAFIAHNEAVKAAIPAHQLLVYQVKEGWGPLCAFLGVAVPPGPFPRSNDRGEFWDLVSGKKTTRDIGRSA
ncbi:MAG TPA: sulfotransferase [Aestuariivirga sp.]|nr:sulfotransferase [Aestuariivirga sp.]